MCVFNFYQYNTSIRLLAFLRSHTIPHEKKKTLTNIKHSTMSDIPLRPRIPEACDNNDADSALLDTASADDSRPPSITDSTNTISNDSHDQENHPEVSYLYIVLIPSQSSSQFEDGSSQLGEPDTKPDHRTTCSPHPHNCVLQPRKTK